MKLTAEQKAKFEEQAKANYHAHIARMSASMKAQESASLNSYAISVSSAEALVYQWVKVILPGAVFSGNDWGLGIGGFSGAGVAMLSRDPSTFRGAGKVLIIAEVDGGGAANVTMWVGNTMVGTSVLALAGLEDGVPVPTNGTWSAS